MSTRVDRHTVALAWKSWVTSELEPHGPAWLQWALTGVFCAGIAVAFTVLGFAMNAIAGGRGWTQPAAWLRWYGMNLGVSLVIGYLIHAMFAVAIPLVGKARIRAFSDRQRAVFFSAIPLAGVLIGWPIGVWLVKPDAASWWQRADTSVIVGMVLLSVLVSFVFFQVLHARARQAIAEKQAMEAQLRLLQAQIEPHFLFNTLAGVLSLIEAEPPRARRMLEVFTEYLRASLGSLRTGDSTLGDELALAERYLRLMQLRMEDRLRVEIDVDDSLRDVRLAPLLLQPLVENAIRHAVEPSLAGGRVRIEARRADGGLRLAVLDDGPGARAAAVRGGNGVALDNVSRRLQALHGSSASLALEPDGTGMRATLILPLVRGDA